MNGCLASRCKTGLAAIAVCMALACSPPADEAVIDDLDFRVIELEDSLSGLEGDIQDLNDRSQDLAALRAKVNKHEEFILQGAGSGGGDANVSKEINDLRLQIQTLSKSLTAAQSQINTLKNARTGSSVASTRSQPAANPATNPANTGSAPPRRVTTPPRPEPAREVGHYYEVSGGDTFESIAKSYGISVEKLRGANRMASGHQPRVGYKVWVPSARNN